MRILEVVSSRVWVNKLTGSTASIYGAAPWTGASGNTRADWTVETRGFTWAMSNGTIGFGRKAAATREEAEAVMKDFNAKLDARLAFAASLRV